MEVVARTDPVIGLAVIAAAILVIAGMERHVHIACKVHHEGQRLQPNGIGQAFIGEDAVRALDLGGDAIAPGAVGARVEGLAHRRGAIVPGGGVAPAPALAAHAIGPHGGVLQRPERTLGRAERLFRTQQPRDLGAHLRRDIGLGDLGGLAVGVEAPRPRLARHQQQRRQRYRQHREVQPTISYCSITHCSSSAAPVHSRIHSCSAMASI